MTTEEPVCIKCIRHGGKRFAYACAHFDRYRGCRKHCPGLEKVMKEDALFVDKVKKCYEGKESLLPSKRCCEGLPLEEEKPHTCEKCGYVAASERGLKSHMTRSHKK